MAPTENQQQPFPAVPPSLSAGDHEMRDYYASQDAPRPTINQTPYLTPYLGLRARLSQVWINRWTVLLLLILVRTLIAIASINDNLASSRKHALSACSKVENIGSSMASMPHYMSQGVNELTASGVERGVNGLMSMLDLSVAGVEEIVLFVIHMMTQTYLCLITLAVSGSLHAAVELGTEVYEALNKTVDAVTGSIADKTKSFQDNLNDFMDTLKSLPFADFKPPTFDFGDDIQKLKTLEVPPKIQEGLQELNKSIPDFKDVQNFTDSMIRLPFEEVRKLINESLTTYSFNRTLLPVPQKETLTFCSESNGINDFFDNLIKMEITARKIFLGVIIVLAILVCIPMAYREVRRYRWMERRAQLITTDSYDSMDAVYLASRPYTSSFGLKIANRFGSTRRQIAVRWAVAYATSTPALFILSLGVAGLFACLCQYILLKKIEQEVPELTNQVADFAGKVVNSLNNASQAWALGVNRVMNDTSTDINNDIFGWVNTSTTAVNNTLNTFVDEMRKVLNTTFGGTVLYDPIQEVLNCLILLKIEGIQKGLTWVSDHAHVDFPLMPNDTFSLGTAAKIDDGGSSAELLSDPTGKTRDEITETITDLVDKLVNGIKIEAIISTCVIMIWVIIAIIGIIRACTLLRGGNTLPATSRAYTIDPSMDNSHSQHYLPDSAAPPYEYSVNKAAPYTIQPRPFPTFEPTNTSSRQEDEKVHQVDAHNVAESTARPVHLRNSSHGHLATGNSPYDEKRDPFSDSSPYNEKSARNNPFAG